jgi:anti-anti-sigma factor
MIGIGIQKFNDTAILMIRGELKLGDETISARAAFDQVIGGYGTIILDLSSLAKIDCAGLGELVRLESRVGAGGGAVFVFGVTRQIRDLLTITRLVTLFPCGDIDIPRAA